MMEKLYFISWLDFQKVLQEEKQFNKADFTTQNCEEAEIVDQPAQPQSYVQWGKNESVQGKANDG